jgi:hypothetical protein
VTRREQARRHSAGVVLACVGLSWLLHVIRIEDNFKPNYVIHDVSYSTLQGMLVTMMEIVLCQQIGYFIF